MDAIKTTGDAIASLRAARDAQLREFAEQEASLQADLDAATKAAADHKAAAAKKAAEDQAAAAAANATAAAAAAAAASAKETGRKACILHCLKTGDKLVANLAQIMGMSGTIRAMVEDLGVDTADSAAAAEIPIAGVSGDVAKGILQCIEAYYADEAACDTAGADADAGAGADADTPKKKAATKMPDTMMGLYRLGTDHSHRGNDDWSNHISEPNYILKLVEAVEFLDMPELMTIILTIVGKEISELAAERMRKLARSGACSTVGIIKAPNGKLSIEGAGCSEDSNVCALADFVSKLRDIQPELVDKGLASVLYKTQPNAALHLNYLIEKEGWNWEDAMACVDAAEAERTGTNVFGDKDRVAYSAEVAAASWAGIGKHSTAVPNLFFGVPIPRVLKQLHPDTEISKVGQKIMSDLIAWAVDAILAAVPASEDADRFATVHTNAFLEDDSARRYASNNYTVLASRLVPRDELLVGDESAEKHTWELRSEVVRVGLADALASFEAKTAAEQEAVFRDHFDLEDGDSLRDYDGVTSPRAIQTAVQRVFPGQLAKHAVSEGGKAVTKFTSYYEDYQSNTVIIGLFKEDRVSVKDGKVQYSGNLTAASDVDDVNSAMSRAAGLQASVLETAHAMHLRLSNPPSLTAAVYLAAVMEYLAAEIIELSGNAARDLRSSWIQPRHLQLAVRGDEELDTIFRNVCILDGGVVPQIHAALLPTYRASAGTDEAVATIEAYLKDDVLSDSFADEGSDCFVSGTRPRGFDKDEIAEIAEGSRFSPLSAGAAWVVNALQSYDDRDGFTTLSKEDQAALLKPSRDKAGVSTEEAAGEAKHVPIRNCRILRDNIQGITPEMVLALAARAGCLMLSNLVFEETRGIIKVYLEKLVRDAVTLAEHKKRTVVCCKPPREDLCVLATDVLAAASQAAERIVCGTGRVASMYANSGGGGGGGGTPSAFATLAAGYAAKLAQDADGDREWAYPAACRGDDEEEFLDLCNEDGFNEAVANAWTAGSDDDSDSDSEAVDEEYDEDEFRGRAKHGSGMPFLTKDEIYADPHQVPGAARRYIRQMQRTSGPCVPFMPLAMLIREIAQDFKTNLDFEPEAFRVMQSMLEDYLVGLFKDANLNCIHGGGSPHRTFPFTGFDPDDPQREKRSLAVTPQDLRLARRRRGERA